MSVASSRQRPLPGHSPAVRTRTTRAMATRKATISRPATAIQRAIASIRPATTDQPPTTRGPTTTATTAEFTLGRNRPFLRCIASNVRLQHHPHCGDHLVDRLRLPARAHGRLDILLAAQPQDRTPVELRQRRLT